MRRKWAEHLEKKGITKRIDKDEEYYFFSKQLEPKWEELYRQELEAQFKEIVEKEERKRLREEKRLLKLKK
jgi:hypothetical protein